MKERLIKALEMFKESREDYSRKTLESKSTVNHYLLGRIEELNFVIWVLEDIVLDKEK